MNISMETNYNYKLGNNYLSYSLTGINTRVDADNTLIYVNYCFRKDGRAIYAEFAKDKNLAIVYRTLQAENAATNSTVLYSPAYNRLKKYVNVYSETLDFSSPIKVFMDEHIPQLHHFGFILKSPPKEYLEDLRFVMFLLYDELTQKTS